VQQHGLVVFEALIYKHWLQLQTGGGVEPVTNKKGWCDLLRLWGKRY